MIATITRKPGSANTVAKTRSFLRAENTFFFLDVLTRGKERSMKQNRQTQLRLFYAQRKYFLFIRDNARYRTFHEVESRFTFRVHCSQSSCYP